MWLYVYDDEETDNDILSNFTKQKKTNEKKKTSLKSKIKEEYDSVYDF